MKLKQMTRKKIIQINKKKEIPKYPHYVMELIQKKQIQIQKFYLRKMFLFHENMNYFSLKKKVNKFNRINQKLIYFGKKKNI